MAAAALVVLLPSAFAEETGPSTLSTGTIPEFHCPRAVAKPAPRVPHVAGLETENTEIPSAADVGDLARPVDLNPPVLDREKIAAFDLRDDSGAPRPRRFAFWGDSHIAAGPMMGQLTAAIRARGESVGTLFLPPTMGRANVRLPTLHAYCIGTGWSTQLAFTAPGTLATGPALANRVASAGPESYLWLDLRRADLTAHVKGVEMVYRASGADTRIAVAVNDSDEVEFSLTPDAGSHLLVIHADALVSTLKLRVTQGQLVLQSFRLDYDEPPLVTFDVFGLPSSTQRGWENADPAAIKDALGGESYDGVVLEYGTNDGNEPDFDRGTYAAGLERALTNMRAVFPDAACVLVGPPDRGVLLSKKGPRRLDYLKYAKIHAQIAAAQAEVGQRFSCVPWNWQDFMGGPGASYGWAHHDPVLMGADLTHMTMDGYKRSGTALATSLGWAGADQSVFPR